MDLWHNPRYPDQKRNLEIFQWVMKDFPSVEFFYPNRVSAPWHVQAVVNGLTLSFWPHLLKCQVERNKSEQGEMATRKILSTALADAFDLIDNDDPRVGVKRDLGL